jgi:hypothetical protein
MVVGLSENREPLNPVVHHHFPYDLGGIPWYTPFSDTHMLVMFDCHPSARLENHGVGNHQPNENDSIPPEPKVDSRAWGKIAADGTGLRSATC